MARAELCLSGLLVHVPAVSLRELTGTTALRACEHRKGARGGTQTLGMCTGRRCRSRKIVQAFVIMQQQGLPVQVIQRTVGVPSFSSWTKWWAFPWRFHKYSSWSRLLTGFLLCKKQVPMVQTVLSIAEVPCGAEVPVIGSKASSPPVVSSASSLGPHEEHEEQFDCWKQSSTLLVGRHEDRQHHASNGSVRFRR